MSVYEQTYQCRRCCRRSSSSSSSASASQGSDSPCVCPEPGACNLLNEAGPFTEDVSRATCCCGDFEVTATVRLTSLGGEGPQVTVYLGPGAPGAGDIAVFDYYNPGGYFRIYGVVNGGPSILGPFNSAPTSFPFDEDVQVTFARSGDSFTASATSASIGVSIGPVTMGFNIYTQLVVIGMEGSGTMSDVCFTVGSADCTFDCVGGECVANGTGEGVFASMAACQAACLPPCAEYTITGIGGPLPADGEGTWDDGVNYVFDTGGGDWYAYLDGFVEYYVGGWDGQGCQTLTATSAEPGYPETIEVCCTEAGGAAVGAPVLVGGEVPEGAGPKVAAPRKTALCMYEGPEYAAAARVELGLGHLRRWKPCAHPAQPLGPHVCGCQGCGTRCPGYVADPSRPAEGSE